MLNNDTVILSKPRVMNPNSKLQRVPQIVISRLNSEPMLLRFRLLFFNQLLKERVKSKKKSAKAQQLHLLYIAFQFVF